MNRKKKTRPSVGALGRAMETESASRADTTSNYYSTTSIPLAQAKIADLLLLGRENAIPRRELEKLTGLDGRTVRLMIERERRAGTLIISDNQHGYFLTDDPVEAQRFAHSMQHRAREILRTARAIEVAAGLD